MTYSLLKYFVPVVNFYNADVEFFFGNSQDISLLYKCAQQRFSYTTSFPYVSLAKLMENLLEWHGISKSFN